MFYCGFCGRNKSAAYDRSALDRGIDMYKQLISESPRVGADWQDRFRISGGQEPLTNPRIGEIVSHAANLDYRVSMYTNGYMLSEKYQAGLNDLASLRISLYGHDDDSYHQVTKKTNAWSIVANNLSNIEMHDTQLGVNYIILSGHVDDYFKLIQALAKLKMKRPLNFITVREDFSQNLIYINDDERKRLIDIIPQVNEYAKQHLPGTKIDYGYALDPLQNNQIIGPLNMATSEQLDPHGIVQASVQVDILGNIYAYHETAFLDRPGGDKFIIGNIKDGLENVLKQHLASPGFRYIPSDTEMLDAFDHAVSLAVWAARRDMARNVQPLFL